MGNQIKAENINLLHDTLGELMNFIRHSYCEEATYFCRFLGFMLDNIEMYMYMPEEDTTFLKCILLRDWNEVNNRYIGISVSDCCRKRKEKDTCCIRCAELILKIDMYLMI